MLVMPHFSLAIALLLLTVRCAAIGLADNRLGMTAIAGLLCFALSFVHPYDVLIALGLAGGVAILYSLRQRSISPAVWRHVGLLLLLGSGPVLYNYWILNNNPGMQAWLVQNRSASPAPVSYLAGYGLLLFGAVLYTVKNRHELGSNLGTRAVAVRLAADPAARPVCTHRFPAPPGDRRGRATGGTVDAAAA